MIRSIAYTPHPPFVTGCSLDHCPLPLQLFDQLVGPKGSRSGDFGDKGGHALKPDQQRKDLIQFLGGRAGGVGLDHLACSLPHPSRAGTQTESDQVLILLLNHSAFTQINVFPHLHQLSGDDVFNLLPPSLALLFKFNPGYPCVITPLFIAEIVLQFGLLSHLQFHWQAHWLVVGYYL